MDLEEFTYFFGHGEGEDKTLWREWSIQTDDCGCMYRNGNGFGGGYTFVGGHGYGKGN
jgi:hypothetical protein